MHNLTDYIMAFVAPNVKSFPAMEREEKLRCAPAEWFAAGAFWVSLWVNHSIGTHASKLMKRWEASLHFLFTWIIIVNKLIKPRFHGRIYEWGGFA
jgi:hypothetical protein